MRPISAFIPVANTTPSPFPNTMGVDMKTSFFRSPTPIASFATKEASFKQGKDSPVNEDSLLLSEKDSRILISAGTILPSSRITMSPGTRSFASTERILPPLRTLARGEDIFFKASKAFSAFFSWTVPITALIRTTAKIMATSMNSSHSCPGSTFPWVIFKTAKMRERTLAPSKMNVMGSLKLEKKVLISESFFFSSKRFSPYWDLLF